MDIILASQSPRRKELMELAQIDFKVKVSNADETFIDGLNIEEQSKRLAYIKAKAVFDNTHGSRAVIGSDTMVIKENSVYEKPKDKKDAIRMLKELQGTSHTVYTSLAVLIEDIGKYNEIVELIKSEVFFKQISDEEIEEYADSGISMDKAGAYAIQSNFCKYVEKINGDYFAIMGLPISKVYEILKKNDCI